MACTWSRGLKRSTSYLESRTSEGESEMTEQTYTREDMARAWDEGRESGTIATMLKLLYRVAHQTWNPYEQEEA